MTGTHDGHGHIAVCAPAAVMFPCGMDGTGTAHRRGIAASPIDRA
jgi:hypothetical protein